MMSWRLPVVGMLMSVSLSAPVSSGGASASNTITCPRPFPQYSSSPINRIDATDPNGRNFHEVSGLVFSPSQIGPSGDPIFFAISDGPRDRVGIFDSGTGNRLVTFRLPDASDGMVESRDWESLAIGSCGESSSSVAGRTCLYVADTGNNVARYSSGKRDARDGSPNRIIKILEPEWQSMADNDRINPSLVSVLPFDYGHESSPVKVADSEAMFVDHVGWGQNEAKGDIYIVTKWGLDGNSLEDVAPEQLPLIRLHKIPTSAWSDIEAQSNSVHTSSLYSPPAVGDEALAFATWSRADMTLDGTMIALGDYKFTYVYARCPGQSVEKALAGSPCSKWPNPFSIDVQKVETTAWTPDGMRSLQLSECDGCDPPMMWTDMEFDDDEALECPGAVLSTPKPTNAASLVIPAKPVLAPATYSPTQAPQREATEQPTISREEIVPTSSFVVPASSSPAGLSSAAAVPTDDMTHNPTQAAPIEGTEQPLISNEESNLSTTSSMAQKQLKAPFWLGFFSILTIHYNDHCNSCCCYI